MRSLCVECHKGYNRVVDQGDAYVPMVCSAGCFLEWLKRPRECKGEVLVNQHDKEEKRRSAYERAFESFLTDKHIRYAYEPYIIRVSNGSGYVPDYFLDDYSLFVEVKGLWERGAYGKFSEAARTYGNFALVNKWFLTKILKKQPKYSLF